MDGIGLAVAGLAALLVGVALGWLLTRSRTADAVEVATGKARGEAAAEVAAARAEAVAARGELERERSELREARAEVGRLRDELDEESNERARLEERARQVEPLERKVQALTVVVEQKNEDIRGRSEREAALVARLAGEEDAHRIARTERDDLRRTQEKTSADLSALRGEHGGATASLQGERDAHEQTRRELAQEKLARERAEQGLAQARTRLGELETELTAERRQSSEKLELLTQAKEELANQFKALAGEILDEKSKKFTEQNQTNLGQLLNPLTVQITDFKKKVEEVYVQEGKDRTELAAHIKTLKDLNQALSRDAQNLASALKGQVKTQGNWGEMLLERLLQHAGLERGQHYEVQESHVREDGTRAQPDFVLKLPNDHRMVVDSKVTLVAYDRYVNAETDAERDAALKEHCAAVRAHIKDLSGKNYQKLYDLQSMDFVVMFMPIEPAFTLAIGNDDALFQDAWDRNILIVTNSTLLFVVRSVAYLWTQEKQNRNAQEIASKGADLLDKLNLFAQEFESLGTKLQQAQKHYDVALGRFATGNANVLRQANALVKLGVKPTKALPKSMQDAVAAQEDVVALPSPDAVDAREIAGLPGPADSTGPASAGAASASEDAPRD